MYDCSIIVVTFNRLSLLKECIISLLNQKTNYKYEIIIVNNNSNDGTTEFLIELNKKYNFIKILHNNNTNISVGRNLAINNSSSDLILFIDDDAIASVEWVDNYIKLFSDHIISAAGGPMYGKFETDKPYWLSNHSLGYAGVLNHDINSQFIDVFKYHLASCNLAIRKNLLFEIGLFNISLGSINNRLLSVEDIEFLYRVQFKYPNSIYYLKEAFVYHFIPKYRITVSYLLKRAFWVSSGTSYSLKSKLKLIIRLKKIPKQIFYLSIGLIMLLFFILFRNKILLDKSLLGSSALGWIYGTFLMKISN